MKAGVCSYCFNSMLTEGKISLMEAVEFVGKETEADCFELYSPYWSLDRDVQEQAREARSLMDRVGLQASCHALATDFAVYDEGENRACLDWCEKMLQVAVILGRYGPRRSPHRPTSRQIPRRYRSRRRPRPRCPKHADRRRHRYQKRPESRR